MYKQTLCCCLTFAVLFAAHAQEANPSFEVASVKPDKRISWVRRPWTPDVNCAGIGHCGVSGNRFIEDYASLDDLIMDAYRVRRYQIVNAPSWADTGQDVYQIEAKAAGDSLTLDQARLMLQNLLKDRFQLKIHHETRDLPVYALMPGKNGTKLVPSQKACAIPGLMQQGTADKGGAKQGDKAPAAGAPEDRDDALSMIQSWAIIPELLAGRLDRPVVDKTGFEAPSYCLADGNDALMSLLMKLGPGGGGRGGDPQNRTAVPDADSTAPSIFSLTEELWGLKLDAQKSAADVLVIDHVERPSEN
jgi:uncharacterized protein (TIGR03435 family)